MSDITLEQFLERYQQARHWPMHITVTDLPDGCKQIVFRCRLCNDEGQGGQVVEFGTTVKGDLAKLSNDELTELVPAVLFHGLVEGHLGMERQH